MMLRYSFDMAAEADAVEAAVDAALKDGCRCGDIAQGGAVLAAGHGRSHLPENLNETFRRTTVLRNFL